MTNWRRSTTLIISLLALMPLYKLVQACADIGDPYDDYPSFFQPAVSARPAYQPFHYQAWLKYYDDWYDAPSPGLPDENIREWATYTGSGIPEADLDSFIYRYSYADLHQLYDHLEKNRPLKLPAPVQANGMTKWFMAGKDLEALGYLLHAKQCEPYAVGENEWSQPADDTAKMGRLIRNGLQLHAAAKKDFFRERYAFQAMRMAYYARRPRQTLDLFDQLTGSRESSSYTYARCLSLKAGALFRLNRQAEAAYWFSRVFDRADGLKRSAYISFDWCVGQNAAPVLPLCRSDHERAVVHIMDGLHDYEYGLPSLEAAYTADPAVAGLDVLMVREINKAEERYQQPLLQQQRNITASGYYAPYYLITSDTAKTRQTQQQYRQYIGRLNDFAQKVAAGGKQDRKAFWRLASAYLYFMQDRQSDYRGQLALAGREQMSGPERDLYEVLQVLQIVRSSPTVTPAVEAQLLPRLEALQRRKDRKAYRDVLGMILTTAYLRQHDTVRAIYTLARSADYIDESYMDLPGSLLERMSTDKLQEVKAFVQQRGKTAYERWLLDSNRYDLNRLYELEGTKYLRGHRFEAAADALSHIPEEKQLPDPFIASLSERMELQAEDTARPYSKLAFAREMAGLERRLPTADAATVFRYATGLYSMTYYGKANNAYTYYRSSVDAYGYFNSNERKSLPDHAQDFYGALSAERYYLKAAELAGSNAELKARCIFMAAKCWQKRAPSEMTYSEFRGQDEYFVNALHNPYFQQLTGAYRNTRFFQEATGGCDYFKLYAQRHR